MGVLFETMRTVNFVRQKNIERVKRRSRDRSNFGSSTKSVLVLEKEKRKGTDIY